MAMNKKEQAAFEALQQEVMRNRALRWSDYDTETDLPVPSSYNEYVNGWTFNATTRRVYESWSSAVSHGSCHVIDGKRPAHASQQGIRQYSSRERALKAMRRSMEADFASALASVDKQIEESTRAA